MQFQMTSPTAVVGWVAEGQLGCGGFGNVQVLRNEKTNQYIALKMSNKAASMMSDKEKERWTQECKIMQRLNHKNVVRGLPLPPELSHLSSEHLPVLVMEYCSLGNLRMILNKAENACGLSERKVRCIAQDMTAAVEYLHSEKIIHRDIKPENIVLSQEPGQRVLYKLIDLGYAKDLSTDGTCISYVGTLQYLAPELLTSKNYNNTVDYWCLGMVVFECIAGFRPFQQQQQSDQRQWLNVVRKKSKSHISAVVNDQGETVYSDKLPMPNQLCSMSQSYFEQWLRLLLLFDPEKRGGGQTDENNPRPLCYAFIDRIINTKLIHIYSVPTNEVVSFPVVIEKDTSSQPQLLEMFAKIIRSRLGVLEQDQEFITRTGSVAPQTSSAALYSSNQDEEGEIEDLVDLFMVCTQTPQLQPHLQQLYKLRQYPARLELLVQNREKDQLLKDKKETVKHAVYYCSLLYLDFLRLLDAYKAVNLCISRQQTQLTDLISELRVANSDLKIRTEIFIQSCEGNIAEFESLHQSRSVYSQSAVARWTKKKNEVSQNMSLGRDVEKCIAFSEQMSKRILELHRSSCVSDNVKIELQKFKMHALSLYNSIRSASNIVQAICPTTEIIRCVEGCKEKFIQLSTDVCSQIGKLLNCKTEMINKEPGVKNLLEKVVSASNHVIRNQRHQQKDVWSLYAQTIDMFRNKSGSTSSLHGSLGDNQPGKAVAEAAAAGLSSPPAAVPLHATAVSCSSPCFAAADATDSTSPHALRLPQSVSSFSAGDMSGLAASGGSGLTEAAVAGPSDSAAVVNGCKVTDESVALMQESSDLRSMMGQLLMNFTVGEDNGADEVD